MMILIVFALELMIDCGVIIHNDDDDDDGDDDRR